jgi:hypothetical protein
MYRLNWKGMAVREKLRSTGMKWVLLMVLAVGAMHLPAQAQSPGQPAAVIQSPTQVAYLQAKVKEARKLFSRDAAGISGVPADKILLCLPDDWRAGDPRYAIIPCLEKARATPLGPEERKKIGEADLVMKAAIARARTEALQR